MSDQAHPHVDAPRVHTARAMASRYTPKAKLLELQAAGAVLDNANTELSWSQAYCGWAFHSVPAAPTTDAQGNVAGACELVIVEEGDRGIVIGQRDARWSKYSQDLKPGESAQINAFGDRLLLSEKNGALVAGGGSLLLDKDKKVVSLTGIPSTPGGNAPYLSISTSKIGLVSSTGSASINVDAAQVSVSGAAVSLDVGTVALGKGASDPVVMNSLLAATLVVLQAWVNTHTHTGGTLAGALTGPPVLPLVLSTFNGSLRTKTA